MSLSLGIIGAAGKMGRTLLRCSAKDPEVKVTAGCDAICSPFLGRDLGHLIEGEPIGINLKGKIDEIVELADVLIDFSLPSATVENARVAAKHQKPLVIGTTGHPLETQLALESLAKQIPLLFSPNFSLGMALCLEMSGFLGRHLKGSCFVDIIETHHTQKKDAPSGTALALAKSLDFGRICPGTMVEQPRSRDTVAIHSIRSGEVTGEHRIIFECRGERIEIKHEALSREAFAEGALRAAKFLAHCAPGLYTMKDLLNA